MSELRRRISESKRPTVNVTMPSAPQFAPTPAAPSDDLVSRLAKLAELRDAGVLTEYEFAAAKARLLAGPSA
ncbi:hypothetical protein DEO23_12170 [Brachybacterium endophyticum]|uniref:SHOCT domain-containing protein n=2 Tax=Brachybacterium endophyticum TaxID=2182385 RepID=A0A2U2RID7_9MICO|nr:hypothetical protein DEO23_12170 [Brachybacterium endophyticum]